MLKRENEEKCVRERERKDVWEQGKANETESMDV